MSGRQWSYRERSRFLLKEREILRDFPLCRCKYAEFSGRKKIVLITYEEDGGGDGRPMLKLVCMRGCGEQGLLQR